jgi:hypothetical protein
MNWRRSSRCDTGTCVWVSTGHATVWVRDDTGQTLVVSHTDWRQLLAHLRTRGVS